MRTSRQLLNDVPRSVFLPDIVWEFSDTGMMSPVRRHQDPDRWQRLCDDDDAVVTQVDAQWGVTPTSSSSAPYMMAEMLDALDLAPGMRVLEIGTGTGYNAAVLAEAVGAENVTTIEVDSELAGRARTALTRAGYPVAVITGDGAAGYPPHGPYDRVIVTAAATRVPHTWVSQTRPGGKIVVPWASGLDTGGALAVLTVGDDQVADGRFLGGVGFMYMREHRPQPVSWVEDTEDGDFIETSTETYPAEFVDDDPDAFFALGAALPWFTPGKTRGEDGSWTTRLSHAPSGSWAGFTPGEGKHRVQQHGPRRLWDELEPAYRWWIDAGRPGHQRFGMTVTEDDHRVWLDDPGGPSWSLVV